MRSRTPDRLCADAVELARGAAEEAVGADLVGEHLGAVADGDRVVTHLFECRVAGYRGWRWAVTVARASRAKHVTLDETVLVPGPQALLAPEWVPWSERLRPGDLGPGDLLPAEAEDLRLERGVGEPSGEPSGEPDASGPDAAVPAEGLPPGAGAPADDLRLEPEDAVEPGAEAEAALPRPEPRPAEIAAVADELGMGRSRVLSRYGLHSAADRWEERYGPKTAMAQAAPAACESCGFLMPVAGSLRQAFGVCANEFSPADGHLVSLAYGCGGHSEAAVMPKPVAPAPPVLDEMGADSLE